MRVSDDARTLLYKRGLEFFCRMVVVRPFWWHPPMALDLESPTSVEDVLWEFPLEEAT